MKANINKKASNYYWDEKSSFSHLVKHASCVPRYVGCRRLSWYIYWYIYMICIYVYTYNEKLPHRTNRLHLTLLLLTGAHRVWRHSWLVNVSCLPRFKSDLNGVVVEKTRGNNLNGVYVFYRRYQSTPLSNSFIHSFILSQRKANKLYIKQCRNSIEYSAKFMSNDYALKIITNVSRMLSTKSIARKPSKIQCLTRIIIECCQRW